MGRLIYSALVSIDGYVNDAEGNYDWAAPSPQVHAFVNEIERPTTTHLYGRRLYEEMAVWETWTSGSEEERGFGEHWRGLDKVVYSTTLDDVNTQRTRLERFFDPAAVRAEIAASPGEVVIGGPTLAQHALRAGIVDEVSLFILPKIVGGGTPFFPAGLQQGFSLRDERRFEDGTRYVSYVPS